MFCSECPYRTQDEEALERHRRLYHTEWWKDIPEYNPSFKERLENIWEDIIDGWGKTLDTIEETFKQLTARRKQ